MKIDFHVHTTASPDSLNRLKTINKVYKKAGITPVISDHNRISNAIKYKKQFGNCIVAEEILTTGGEIMCLFANQWIKPRMSPEETVDKIREQGALVYVPHPFDRLRSSSLKEINFKPDVVEVFNARVVKQQFNSEALAFADKHKILKGVGSDAHFPFELGSSYVELDYFDSIKEFKKNLRNAKATVRSSNPVITHPLTKAVFRTRKYLLGHYY